MFSGTSNGGSIKDGMSSGTVPGVRALAQAHPQPDERSEEGYPSVTGPKASVLGYGAQHQH